MKLVRWAVETDERLASRGLLAGYSASSTAKAPEVWQARNPDGSLRWTLDIGASLPKGEVSIVAAVGTKTALYVATRCADKPCDTVLRFDGPDDNKTLDVPVTATLRYTLVDAGGVQGMWRYGRYLISLAPENAGRGGFRVHHAPDGSLLASVANEHLKDLSRVRVSVGKDDSLGLPIELARPDGEVLQLVVGSFGGDLYVEGYWLVGPACETFGARVREVCRREGQSAAQKAVCGLAHSRLEALFNPEEYLKMSGIGPDGHRCVEMQQRFDDAFTASRTLPLEQLSSLSWAADCRAAVALLEKVCADTRLPAKEQRRCGSNRETATGIMDATIIGGRDQLRSFLCRRRLEDARELESSLAP